MPIMDRRYDRDRHDRDRNDRDRDRRDRDRFDRFDRFDRRRRCPFRDPLLCYLLGFRFF